MPSYTAQVILANPIHTSKTAMYHYGDIVAAYELVTEKPNPNGRLGFVHVHNVPDAINLSRLTEELSRPEILSVTENQELSKKRAWMIKLDTLSIINKETNIDWSEAINLFTRKFDGKTGAEYYAELNL
tara:strand:+ start:30 stop:416 length:387 start_codon:yes stop_codon:yes gene_type:complete